MVRLAGSEPATRCLEGSRSIQLSYRRRTTYCEGPRSRVGHRAEPGWSLCGVGLGGYCPSLGAANRVSGAQPGLGCLRSWGDRRQNDRYPPVRTRDPPVKGGLLVAGTTSDAGKSVLTAGLCRWLARQGVRVAPFKAQNMSLNSFVTPDGAEIGRAQAMQATAAGIEPDARMNPVLLKPGAAGSQVVVLGHPDGEVDALSYPARKAALLDVALDALGSLRREFDVVVCEGAGSPAEINL